MSAKTDAAQSDRTARKSLLKLWGLSLLATALLFGLALKLMGPAPPKHLVLATGSKDGAYYHYGQKYAELLAKKGIEVELRETAGSVENLALLTSGEADVALVQSGTPTEAQRETLQSIASVFLEPLWIFRRGDAGSPGGLAGLKGLRVAVGPEGSGTRALAVPLLELTGALPAGEARPEDRVLPLGGSAAAKALLEGRIDAAFFVVAPEAAYVEQLLASPDVVLLALPLRAALVRRYRFLDEVYLPRGLLSLGRVVPRQDLYALAPTAALVSGKEVHPSIPPLLIEAARRVHEGGGLIAEPGRFPSPHHVDIPVADSARRYFDQGPSWAYRVFPFRLASFLDRAIFLLLPLVTLLFPLLKTAPPLYRWGVRRRVYRWYRNVRDADRATTGGAPREALEAELAKLETIGDEVAHVSIPLSYMREFYDLRLHLDFVKRRLQVRLGVDVGVDAGVDGESDGDGGSEPEGTSP